MWMIEWPKKKGAVPTPKLQFFAYFQHEPTEEETIFYGFLCLQKVNH